MRSYIYLPIAHSDPKKEKEDKGRIRAQQRTVSQKARARAASGKRTRRVRRRGKTRERKSSPLSLFLSSVGRIFNFGARSSAHLANFSSRRGEAQKKERERRSGSPRESERKRQRAKNVSARCRHDGCRSFFPLSLYIYVYTPEARSSSC